MTEHGVLYKIKAADTVNKVLVNAAKNGRHTESQFGKINKQVDRNKSSMLGFNKQLQQGKYNIDKLGKSNGLDILQRKFKELQSSGFNLPHIGGTGNLMALGRVAGPMGLAIGGVVAGGAGLFGVANKLEQVLGPTVAKYEKYEAVLENTLGSQKGAKIVMNDIVKLAKETPETVDSITDAWIRYSNQGLKPSMYQMKRLIDLNKSTNPNRNATDLAEAVNDAKTGEFIRLREFGIVARKEGSKLSFMFRDQKTVVENTSDAILNYLVGLGEMKGVMGVSDKIMTTHGGKLSNLEDQYDMMKRTLGDKLKPVLSEVIVLKSRLATKLQDVAMKFLNNDDLVNKFAGSLNKMGNIAESAIDKTVTGFGKLFDFFNNNKSKLEDALSPLLKIMEFQDKINKPLGRLLYGESDEDKLKRLQAERNGLIKEINSTDQSKITNMPGLKYRRSKLDDLNSELSILNDKIGRSNNASNDQRAKSWLNASGKAKPGTRGFSWSQLNALNNSEVIDPYAKGNGASGAGGAGGKGGIKDSINDLVSGSRDSKHFHVNIDSLVKEQNNYMEKLEDNPNKIKRIIEELLMTAIRDVQILEGSR